MTKSFLKSVIITQVALCIMVSAFMFSTQFNRLDHFSLFLGEVLSLVNFVLLITMWKIVFKKKNIALLMLTIVSKYASLALVIGYVVKTESINKISFICGLLFNPISILLCLLLLKLTNRQRNYVI